MSVVFTALVALERLADKYFFYLSEKKLLVMTNITPPVSEFEPKRIMDLSKLDLDYSALANEFEDLTKLAAQVAGTPVSLINLIDSFNQWSIASHGISATSMPREESVCQYTIASESGHFEVRDLAEDERFKNKSYVGDPEKLRYYMGIPLKGGNGSNIGALCVLDTQVRELAPERTALLKIIANGISQRLQRLKKIKDISNRLTAAEEEHKTLARDIREPLAGIIGILQVIKDKGTDTDAAETMELLTLMQKSAETILAITDNVLNTEEERKLNLDQGDLTWLKNSIETLYAPQCRENSIDFQINISSRTQAIPFLKKNLLQILGNVIAYAINHSAKGSTLTTELTLKINASDNMLVMAVRYTDTDPAAGMITKILNNHPVGQESTAETRGQALWLVKKLVDDQSGSITAEITDNNSMLVTINIPQSR